MTPERKAEVNRRLAEFEKQVDASVGLSEIKRFPNRLSDYCEDLNALARLEGKLPSHEWDILVGVGVAVAKIQIYAEGATKQGSHREPTEAEARAEAICQYLESKHG